jgi:hypothetical protein
MSLFFMLIIVAAAAMGVYYYWREDGEQRDDPKVNRAFLIWAAKGLLVPLLLWIFFNSGMVLESLFPRVAGGAIFLPATAAFLFYAGTWWVVVSLAWIAARVCLRTEKRMEFFSVAAVWLLFATPIAFFIVLLLNGGGIGLACAFCFGAVVHGTLRITPFEMTKKMPPTYSRALARMAFDKFNEAEMEIIHQLEKAESDFDGWMLLAELYAVHFHDLKTAEHTICELCDDPNTNPAQVAISLNRLADWHLKLDNNPANARWALDKLCERLPNTHMAKMAEARVRNLPATREEYLKQQARGHTVRLLSRDELQPLTADESHGDEQWLRAPEGHLVRITERRATPTTREAAAQQANECVEQLKTNPDDFEARERFALILAESLGQSDAAIEQLNLLLAVPDQADAQRAKWLSMQAEWHLKHRNSADAARETLQRLIRECPQTREAFDAQRRIYLMQVDTAVKLKRRPPPGAKISAAAESLPRRA